MRKNNIFVFGGTVSGPSFLGRQTAVEKVSSSLRNLTTSKGYAIIGMNRIGKSSLINKVLEQEFSGTDVIVLKESVNINGSPNAFWHRLVMDLKDALKKAEIVDEEIKEALDETLQANVDSSIWLSSYLDRNLKTIMARLNALERRVVLVLDEFDAAMELFQQASGSLGIVRDLASQSGQSVTVITLSRRKLHMIERRADPSSSTLDGVFDKYYLKAFDESDMEQFWDALIVDYEIPVDEAMMNKMQELAGHQPYLLSLYGNRMAELSMKGESVTAQTLDEIQAEEFDKNICPHYDTLVERMVTDGYAGKLRGALCGLMSGISPGDIQSFLDGGYMEVDEEGYYILSREFTRYFMRKTQDMFMPTWDAIMSAERTLKGMVRKIYPRLDDYRYSDLLADYNWPDTIHRIYPDFYLSKPIVEGNMRSGSDYGQDPTITDSLGLKFVVEQLIRRSWNKFGPLFGGGDFADWEAQLNLLVRVRTPLAHDHPEYLTDTENNLLPIYCQQIIDLNVVK